MPQFFRPTGGESLRSLIAQMQAQSANPLAEGISGAAQSIAQGVTSGLQMKRQNEITGQNRIIELMGKGQIETPTGTIVNGQRVMDQPSPGAVPLRSLLGEQYAGVYFRPKQDSTTYVDPRTGQPVATVTGKSRALPLEMNHAQNVVLNKAVLSNYPVFKNLGFEEGDEVPLSIFNAQTKPENLNKIKPPQGFRWTAEGDLEAIPGGPADIKATKEEDKQANMRSGAIAQATRIIGTIDQALTKVGKSTSGLGGSVMVSVPGSSARDLASDLNTIKANLGFAELQAMRQASPTGGALGQVAVQELEALQSTVASLDQSQSPEQLSQRLNDVKRHYKNWAAAIQAKEDNAASGVKKSTSAKATATNAVADSEVALAGDKAKRLQELREKAKAGGLK